MQVFHSLCSKLLGEEDLSTIDPWFPESAVILNKAQVVDNRARLRRSTAWLQRIRCRHRVTCIQVCQNIGLGVEYVLVQDSKEEPHATRNRSERNDVLVEEASWRVQEGVMQFEARVLV